MENRIATILSRIFNPLLITTIFMVIMLNLQFYFATSISGSAKWTILGLTMITTLIIPALLSNVLHVLLNKRLSIEGKDSRLLPLAIAAVFYLFTYHLFDRVSLSPIFSLFILGMASLAVISMLIIIFRNISIYMVGAGALAGGFAGIQMTLQVNLIAYIFIALLIGGMAGFARLSKGNHKPVEIYTGFFIGAAIMLAHYLYL
jgi:hypothetical protein